MCLYKLTLYTKQWLSGYDDVYNTYNVRVSGLILNRREIGVGEVGEEEAREGLVEERLVVVVWGRGDSIGVWYSSRMDYCSNIYGCEEGEG